jgi:lipopolysaccharide export system protein LptA
MALAMPVSLLAQEASPAMLDTDKPIDITADALEVLQNQQRAIFSGNVLVVQGNIKMRAEKMVVHYRQKGEGSKEEANSVSLIEVDGDVFLTTPTETAKGDKGRYVVDEKRVELTGNVVLTRGKSVVRGSRLDYDMATATSKLTGGASAGEGKPASAPGQRVRGLFVPEKAEGK